MQEALFSVYYALFGSPTGAAVFFHDPKYLWKLIQSGLTTVVLALGMKKFQYAIYRLE